MPDDWPGHPQRKDYPLGGIPVEYKGGTDPAARRAEVLQLMSTTDEQRPVRRHRAETTEGRVFTVTGQDWDSIVAGPRRARATSGSSSTWARSTRRPTACSG